MPTYYNGNLDKDLESIADLPYLEELKEITNDLKCGRTQQLLEWMRDGVAIDTNAFETRHLPALDALRERHTAHRLIEVIQILWAENLRDIGLPTNGALGNAD